MSNSLAGLVQSLGSRTNPEVSSADVINYLVKKYYVNPYELVNDIKNEKIERAKQCVHRLERVDPQTNDVKCILCDIKYPCESCAKSRLIEKPQKSESRNQYITNEQCSECMFQVEYYIEK